MMEANLYQGNKNPKGYETCQIEIDKDTMKSLLKMFKSVDKNTTKLAIDIFRKRNFSEETIKNSQCILDMMFKSESFIFDHSFEQWAERAYSKLLFREKN